MGSNQVPGEAPRYSFKHAGLGEIQGIVRGGDFVQFRGIPFADIPARFRQASLKTTLPQQPFDATQPGPTCPQLTSQTFPPFWEGPLAEDGIVLDKPKVDEFGCLNLNITAPRDVLEGHGKVPVLVFIHGGALMVGSSSLQVADREIYDGIRLAQRSVYLGRPIVVVSINYRLGPLGFLASTELEAFNKHHGEAVGNYGLHDQRQALEWVSRFIGDFGGDAQNVTIQGGSAGGVSCHFQAQFPDTKTKRAILSSGTVLTLGAMPIAYHQDRFDSFVSKFCPDSQDAVKGLHSVQIEEFVQYPIAGFYYPVIDNEWIKGRTATALQKRPTSVELLIGSCAFEQDLTLSMMGALDPAHPLSDKALRDLMRDFLTTAGLTTNVADLFGHSILDAYHLNDTLETPSRNLVGWAELVADMVFRIPPYLIGLKNPGANVYLYDFQATNPFPGWEIGYGKSNHAISDLFLFNAAEDLVAEKHRAEYVGAVHQLQKDWLEFCYGELNWEPFQAGDEKRLGPVYALANHGNSNKYDSLEAALGETVANKWKTVLKAAETL
ncbi:Alpha/Beta hydrolase protein [Ilyonectria destructans]|nr:Alpha/Beta hydrolase protein [Ilyonectria destructans]